MSHFININDPLNQENFGGAIFYSLVKTEDSFSICKFENYRRIIDGKIIFDDLNRSDYVLESAKLIIMEYCFNKNFDKKLCEICNTFIKLIDKLEDNITLFDLNIDNDDNGFDPSESSLKIMNDILIHLVEVPQYAQ